MRKKIAVIILSVCNALILCTLLAYAAAPSVPERPERAARVVALHDAPASAGQENVGVPVRMQIPSIGVDAAIESVALAADGSMGVPKHPMDAAWYELGPRPGEVGSATMTGHLDWFKGATAVFKDLRKVKPGDTITVQDDAGKNISFVVREIRKYDAAADADDVFISHDGKAHLNIITCTGTWDTHAKQYSDRLVVFADRVTE